MTSSKKKHHPPGAAAKPPAGAKPVTRAAQPATTVSTVTRKQWIIRIVSVLAIALGVTMTLIGAGPDVAGGNGKLLLMVPGMVIVAGGFVAIVETTPYARSKRR